MQDSEKKSNCAKHAVYAFEHIRALHLTLFALMADVAALRQTLLEDEFLTRKYEKRLRMALKKSRPFVGDALQAYDDIISRIQNAAK